VPHPTEIPTQADLHYPIIAALRLLGGTAPIAKIDEAVIIAERLTDEQLRLKTLSGVPKITGRIAWARTDLKNAGLLQNDGKGTWRLTEAGHAVTEEEVGRLLGTTRALHIVQVEPVPVEPEPGGAGLGSVDREVLQERIESMHREIREQLLVRILNAPPSRLEQVILDLLSAMGYGTQGGHTEVIGGAGDGGVDGVVYEDPLQIRRLYCQAKRYALGHKVGPGDIREFIGALDIKRRNEGVFVTTSAFTAQATSEANGSSKHIRLIDGAELAELMFTYGIGTKTHTFEYQEMDPDYFG
jgi:restriction system protein